MEVNSMGGRGSTSGIDSKQMSFAQYTKMEEIKKIIEESTKIRESGVYSSNRANSPELYRRCQCCENYTIPINSINATCSVCGWIDDEYQNKHPDSLNGINDMSLNEARKRRNT